MKTYPIEVVCKAIGITPRELNHLLYEYTLPLASKYPGGGTRWEFQLIDIYILAIAQSLVGLNLRRKAVCEAVDHFLWGRHIENDELHRDAKGLPELGPLAVDGMRRGMTEDYIADPSLASVAFSRRETQWPIFIVGYYSIGKLRLEAMDDQGLWLLGFRGHRALFVVNATARINDIHNVLKAMEVA